MYSKNLQTHKTSIVEYKTLRDNYGKADVWISEHANFPPRDVKGEYFAKQTEKFKILGNFFNKSVKNREEHVSTKVRDLIDPKGDEDVWICSTYPIGQKITPHYAEREANCLITEQCGI